MFWLPTTPKKFVSLRKRKLEIARDSPSSSFTHRSTLNTLCSVLVSTYYSCSCYIVKWILRVFNLSSLSTLLAGSAGDPNAPQLIVENRAVMLDYTKDRNPLDRNPNATSSVATKAADWTCSKCQCSNFARRNECFKCSTLKTEDCSIVTNTQSSYGSSSDHLNVATKADWICSKCQCQNFAKRHECFKCLVPRSEDCITVSANQNPDSDQITNAVSTSDFAVFVLIILSDLQSFNHRYPSISCWLDRVDLHSQLFPRRARSGSTHHRATSQRAVQTICGRKECHHITR